MEDWIRTWAGSRKTVAYLRKARRAAQGQVLPTKLAV